MRRLVPVLLLAALPLAVGCGDSKTASVSGVVTLDGKPLENAHVRFEPIPEQGIEAPGPTAHGRTDAQGRYSLKMFQTQKAGALIGKHRVSITTHFEEQSQLSDVGPKLPPEKVPARYNTKTELTFEVPDAGTDSANFVLKTR